VRLEWSTTAALRSSFAVGKQRFDIGYEFGAVPVLLAADFAVDFAVGVDDVGFGVEIGAVIFGDFFSGIAIIREGNVVFGEKFFVGGGIFVDADSEDGAAVRRDFILQSDERINFGDAGRAPRGPEIQDDNFSAEIAEVRGFSI
jgi:hypothetical protein